MKRSYVPWPLVLLLLAGLIGMSCDAGRESAAPEPAPDETEMEDVVPDESADELDDPGAEPTAGGEGEDLAVGAGGNLKCYGGKNGGGKVLRSKINSAHNCCSSPINGKSWTCPTINGGDAVNCTKDKSSHCA